jgi:hypothetical protein
MSSTVKTRPRRRAVRRGTLERAYDIALAGLPPELHPLVIEYVDNLRDGDKIRGALTMAMIGTGFKWRDVDAVARDLNEVPPSVNRPVRVRVY